MDIDRLNPRVNFGVIGDIADVIVDEKPIRSERKVLLCSNLLKNPERTSGNWQNVSTEENCPQLKFQHPGPSKSSKREVNEVEASSNAWKKSMPVELRLSEDVGSFLRGDGLVTKPKEIFKSSTELKLAVYWDVGSHFGHFGLSKMSSNVSGVISD